MKKGFFFYFLENQKYIVEMQKQHRVFEYNLSIIKSQRNCLTNIFL